MKITPMGDRILIKLEEVAQQTASGLYIPQTAQEKTQIGTVEAVGDSSEIKVSVGQKVMFEKYAGTTVKADGEEKLILKMENILATIA